ncbi:four helix bundle protein [Eubacterium pyruvativorans]|uniref:four helix bundle protein n=1 Tax=Eubacterium pyruvativorans TaxID=155865 RepID=UPI003F88DDA1
MSTNYDLTLQKKTEILLNEHVYPMLKHYPNAEKFALCQEIKQTFYRILRNCALFKNAAAQHKMPYLRAIDAELQYGKILFNISRDQRYITKKKAYFLQMQMEELGRILGGLMRSVRTY